MKAYLGVDVQSRRKLSFFVCDDVGHVVSSRWLSADEDPTPLVDEVESRGYKIAGIGIDAPRHLLIQPRRWYWKGPKRGWRQRSGSEKGHGRHCEVVVSAHGLAKPQWSPLRDQAPEWMRTGLRLYKRLDSVAKTHEVFPSASYRMLQGEENLTATLDLGQLFRGPKDMIDACIAAVTVREFLAGRGCAVGGGDMLGQLVLPRPIREPIPEVFEWPS